MKTRTQLLEEALDAAKNLLSYINGHQNYGETLHTLTVDYKQSLAALDAAKEEPELDPEKWALCLHRKAKADALKKDESDTVTLPRELVEKTVKNYNELLYEFTGNNTSSDSYGVPGSDWAVCDLCDAEDKPGIFAKGINHEDDCKIKVFQTTSDQLTAALQQPTKG